MIDPTHKVITDFEQWMSNMIAPRKINPDDNESKTKSTALWEEDEF